jgi:hypothetical protein
MRPSPRIVSTLASLAVALGGIVIASPTAHADLADCASYLQDQGHEVTDATRMACYVGLVGDQRGCASALTQRGMSDSVAAEACRRAAQ